MLAALLCSVLLHLPGFDNVSTVVHSFDLDYEQSQAERNIKFTNLAVYLHPINM